MKILYKIESRGIHSLGYCISDFVYCKDQFWLGSKIRLDFGPISPNNKFVERGRKNQSDYRKEITIIDDCEELNYYKIKRLSSASPKQSVCGENLIYFEGDSSTASKMEKLGPHQPTIDPYQEDANLHQAESGGS